ncbi:STAS domain-containing protein [Actinoplanes sp. HUAS TT8]|uniref:STAS domain-containing protein n=1 Tax=Actinoplanes sp. HUAS TT8 TaxID=3447453 RepID=UPI003F525C23
MTVERHVFEDLDTTVIVPRTDLGAEIVETLRPALGKEIQERRYVVIDLRSAGAIDSAGLGLLVRTHQEAKRHGRFLALVAPSRYVLVVLHTMRLDGVFDIFDDLPAALDRVREHPSRNRHTTAR